MHPSTIPNYTLRALKWPVALACLLTWVALPDALMNSDLKDLGFDESLWLLGGAGAYLIGWILIFRHPFSGSYFSTFEHELTHAILGPEWNTLGGTSTTSRVPWARRTATVRMPTVHIPTTVAPRVDAWRLTSARERRSDFR